MITAKIYASNKQIHAIILSFIQNVHIRNYNAVLGGLPQAKAPPAHSLTLCVCGVEMSLLCPPGAPTGAHSLIYQAKPIGRPARKATADFSKIKIIFLGSPCTIFPKVSQTTNESASVVVKHHPVFPPTIRKRNQGFRNHRYQVHVLSI